MDFTLGQLYFYGGIIGMAVTALLSLVIAIILSGSKKRLEKKLEEEYGK